LINHPGSLVTDADLEFAALGPYKKLAAEKAGNDAYAFHLFNIVVVISFAVKVRGITNMENSPIDETQEKADETEQVIAE
jgi:hypothetical protein